MLSVTAATRIFLVAGPTDMRKSFNGLQAIVSGELKKNALSGDLFVFSNRRRDLLKVLYWDRSGFWVCAKRLEEGTFAWPETGGSSVEMTREELALLLGGLDFRGTKRRRWYERMEREEAPVTRV
jgi:transposase